MRYAPACLFLAVISELECAPSELNRLLYTTGTQIGVAEPGDDRRSLVEGAERLRLLGCLLQQS